ncbi:MAG: carbohydrate ABC transporter permease, partial [Candidatus Rokubacteria bacterium]|nr:carbohydrate ABC transporter permease [Candidatus Rokubacteria bacterium]
MRQVGARLGPVCLYLGALGLCAQAILPLLWMLSTSLKPPREVLATPPTLIPAAPTLENFARLLTETAFVTYFLNSMVVSGLTVLLTMAVGAAGAYS